MYRVHTPELVQEQIAELPTPAGAAFAEARVVLETVPCNGRPYNRRMPEGAVGALPFGAAGLVVYVVLERQRRVELVQVVWAR